MYDSLEKYHDFVTTVLAFTYRKDIRAELLWHEAGSVIHFSIDCSDMFWWGCADGEPLTPETLPELMQACDDAKAAGESACWGPELYCCRRRKSRPQGAAYKHLPEVLWPLLDACGPERGPEVGNPCKQPTAKEVTL